jgi:hypothetical protein
MFGEMGEGRLFASLRNWLRLVRATAAGSSQYFCSGVNVVIESIAAAECGQQ